MLYPSKWVLQTFEQEPLTSLGKDDLADLVTKDRLYKTKEGYAFKQAGIYTTENKIFVVLPWICKDSVKTAEIYSSNDDVSLMLDTFFNLKRITGESFNARLNIETGRDLLIYGYLRELELLVESGLKNNVFRSLVDLRKSIQGKWLINQDISKTETPINFTCEISECDTNHPLLIVAREYSLQASQICKSNKLKYMAISLEKKLSYFAETTTNIHQTVNQAEILAGSDKRFKAWQPWIEAIQWFLDMEGSSRRNSITKTGMVNDVELPSPRLFELVTTKLLKSIGYSVKEQLSGKILGGSSWHGSKLLEEDDSEFTVESNIKANSNSRPDIICSKENTLPFLIECKYKQLEIDNSGKIPKMKGLNRNDRNQILSFVLSMTNQTRFNTESIFLVWPSRGCSGSPVPELRFPAIIDFSSKIPNLSWDPKYNDKSNLKIKFLTFDMIQVLREISGLHPKSEIQRIEKILNLNEVSLAKKAA